jgi:hypothetical protein
MVPMHLELHYRVDPLLELDSLKDVVDDYSRNVDFLNHKLGRTTNVICCVLDNKFFKQGPIQLFSNKLEEYSRACWPWRSQAKQSIFATKLTIWSSHFKKRTSWMTSPWNTGFIELPSRKFFYRGHRVRGWTCHFWYTLTFLFHKKESLHKLIFWCQGVFQHESLYAIVHFWKTRGYIKWNSTQMLFNSLCSHFYVVE